MSTSTVQAPLRPHKRPMDLPRAIRAFARACAGAGGRAWVVGGSVRDHLLGAGSKDLDLEVHGLEPDALEAELGRLGPVNLVGRSFGVYKVRVGELDVDVSLPRRDSNTGPGHRGITAEGDPHMGLVEACRRRDLTINAIAYDPLTRDFADPFGGIEDLERGVLRAVDARTFSEDPLRALRVVQFAGRLGFGVDPDLARLCREAPLGELPAERIRGEWEKLLLRAPAPSVGLRLARDLGLLDSTLPAVAGLDPARVGAALDRAAELRSAVGPPPRDLALMLAALHLGASPEQVTDSLDRLRVFRSQGHDLRRAVLGAVGTWGGFASASDAELRRLAESEELTLLAALAQAAGEDGLGALARARVLGVARGPLPALLAGRDVLALGVPAGPVVGRLLSLLRSAQIAGTVLTQDQAVAFVRRTWSELELT